MTLPPSPSTLTVSSLVSSLYGFCFCFFIGLKPHTFIVLQFWMEVTSPKEVSPGSSQGIGRDVLHS